MGVIQNIIEKTREKAEERDRDCRTLLSECSSAVENAYDLLSYSGYIDFRTEREWKNQYAYLFGYISAKEINKYRLSAFFKQLQKKIGEFVDCYDSLERNVIYHNETIAESQIPAAYELVGQVEGCVLDKQQMSCIVKENYNHLVIAGAGTGKTTTIIGKVKYLIASGKYQPSDILVLSFTNASAEEMKNRLEKETGLKLTVLTFHKLGMTIIAKVMGKKPRITTLDTRQFVKDQIPELIKDDSYSTLLNNYLMYNKVQYKSEFDFSNEDEYQAHLQINPPVTVLKERVKSYGEMDIANFLYQNGVKYQYEANYVIDTATEEYAQYHPDFYLPEYDIYIEFFGIDRSGNVPNWFSGSDGKSATQLYQEGIEWKRQLHKSNNTKLIECYSYEKSEGVLLKLLEEKLKLNGVKLTPQSPQEVWTEITHGQSSFLDGLAELFSTIITLIKSNNYSIEELEHKAFLTDNKEHHLALINVIRPLYNEYQRSLDIRGEIDFNDMINLAASLAETGEFSNPFSYVIVDEYQDISKSRFRLLSSMRKTKDYDLFCVGDDWQSIYRFSGSDIGYTFNFDEYWGPTMLSIIGTTYRFSNSLIEISGTFIKQNPQQFEKHIEGKSDRIGFSLGEVEGKTDTDAVLEMCKCLDELPEHSTVYFIGRYLFDINILKASSVFNCKYNNVSGIVDVSYTKRPDLVASFLTAHKSKGLQADYVFIINNKNSRMGFPSKIQDDPIMDLLLDNTDSYPYAEERRLFYVAMTRARIKTFILTVKGNKSVFAKELIERYRSELLRDRYSCPLCGGRLFKRSGPYGEFYGCENYRTIGCRYKREIRGKNSSYNKGF